MKYLVVSEFTDKYTKVEYKPGDVIDITGKRAKEILSVDELIKKIKEDKK